ncbi:MAG: hypothetical protein V2A73_00175, partial [Pseudomonadota bacterium]
RQTNEMGLQQILEPDRTGAFRIPAKSRYLVLVVAFLSIALLAGLLTGSIWYLRDRQAADRQRSPSTTTQSQP